MVLDIYAQTAYTFQLWFSSVKIDPLHKTTMNRRLIVFFVIAFAFVLGLFLIFTPDAPSKKYYSDIHSPLVIAHQGGDGLWPGDTLYAYEHAVTLGADVLEMDAHITRDGQIVLMHDEQVDRT